MPDIRPPGVVLILVAILYRCCLRRISDRTYIRDALGSVGIAGKGPGGARRLPERNPRRARIGTETKIISSLTYDDNELSPYMLTDKSLEDQV